MLSISLPSPKGENQKSMEDIKIKKRKVRFLGGSVAGDRNSSGHTREVFLESDPLGFASWAPPLSSCVTSHEPPELFHHKMGVRTMRPA